MTIWKIKPLSDVCEFQRGLTYSKSDEVDTPGQIVLRATNIDLASNRLNLEELKFIAAEVKIPLSKLVRPGSLIVCTASGSKSHLGKVAFIDEDYGYAFGGFMGQITPKLGVDGRFVFHALTSPDYKKFIDELSDGININNLKFDDLGKFPLPIPALPEQRRIVAILDEAFEAIATAKANTEKILQNARELFEWHHQTAFSRAREVSKDQRLGEIASFRNGINYTKQSKGSLVRIIGVRNFQDHFWAPTEDLDSIMLDGELAGADAVEEGDILSVRSNGNPELIGRCMLVGKFSGLVTHSGFTIRIRLQSRNSLPQYVCQFLKSREVRRKLVDGGTGLNIKSLNQGMLSDLVIPLPPVETQQMLIHEIEAMTESTANLFDTATRKLAALAELNKSLLHQAFTGALTPKSTDKQLEAVA